MATKYNYTGKHVKPRLGIDSLTPRGPERWARAAHNALTNPLSASAKLYVDRVITARKFADYEEARLPFEHVEDTYAGDSFLDPIVGSKRRYVTCNIVCAAMQAQLDFGVSTYHEVAAILRNSYRRSYEWRGIRRHAVTQTNVLPLGLNELKRDVRCQVCGSTVKAVK